MSFFNWVCLEDLYPGPLSAGQLELPLRASGFRALELHMSVVGVGGEDHGGFSGSWDFRVGCVGPGLRGVSCWFLVQARFGGQIRVCCLGMAAVKG